MKGENFNFIVLNMIFFVDVIMNWCVVFKVLFLSLVSEDEVVVVVEVGVIEIVVMGCVVLL